MEHIPVGPKGRERLPVVADVAVGSVVAGFQVTHTVCVLLGESAEVDE